MNIVVNNWFILHFHFFDDKLSKKTSPNIKIDQSELFLKNNTKSSGFLVRITSNSKIPLFDDWSNAKKIFKGQFNVEIVESFNYSKAFLLQ